MGLEGEDEPDPVDGIVQKASKYEKVTRLYKEMEICDQYLGCKHYEFTALPRAEKLKWFLYDRMKIERSNYFDRRRKMKMQREHSGSRTDG